MPAAKGRRLPGLLALLLAVVIATPAAASIPRDTFLEPDPQALLAAVDPAHAPTAPVVPSFDLLPDTALDRLVDGAEPQQLHLFAEPETRLRALDLLAGEQPQADQWFKPGIASGVPRGPNLYQYGLNNPTTYTDPMGLGNWEIEQSRRVSDRQARRAAEEQAARERLETLLFETQWFLAEGTFESHADALDQLSGFLVRRGFAKQHRHESVRLAASLIGPADCSQNVNQTICHMNMPHEFFEGMEFVAVNAAAGVLSEMALAELMAGGMSYVSMLEAVQADAQYGRYLAAVPRATGQSLQRFYPPNQGFLGETERVFLRPGQRIDRFGGSEFSRFFSPSGTPQAARALPPGTAGQPLRTFEVLKPFEVEAGTVAPAYGELGLGTQVRTPVTLKILLERGIIREVTP